MHKAVRGEGDQGVEGQARRHRSGQKLAPPKLGSHGVLRCPSLDLCAVHGGGGVGANLGLGAAFSGTPGADLGDRSLGG